MKKRRRSNRARLLRLRKRIDGLTSSTVEGPGLCWNGGRLRDERERLNLTQAELADAMSILDAAKNGVDVVAPRGAPVVTRLRVRANGKTLFDKRDLVYGAPRFHQSHVSRWERGQAPTADTLAIIVQVLQNRGSTKPELFD